MRFFSEKAIADMVLSEEEAARFRAKGEKRVYLDFLHGDWVIVYVLDGHIMVDGFSWQREEGDKS